MFRVTLLLLLVFTHAIAKAETAPDRAAIEATIGQYFAANDARDPGKLAIAFQPGTIMFWVDADGRLQSMDQKRWKARLADPARRTPAAIERRIVWIDQAGDGASAGALSRFADHQFRDYLTLLRIDGRWRIVGKVFADQPLTVGKGARVASTRDEAERDIAALIRRKFAAMDGNDGGLLASAYLPRAQTFALEGGELVAWPIAEWVARFDADAAAGNRPGGVERRIDRIESTGNVGWARFTHTWPDRRVVDYALFVRSSGVWRIAHLDYLMVPPTER